MAVYYSLPSIQNKNLDLFVLVSSKLITYYFTLLYDDGDVVGLIMLSFRFSLPTVRKQLQQKYS